MTEAASGSMPDSSSPNTTARPMVASPAPIDRSESRSVGRGPSGGFAPAPPGRIGTPQERQTWAQDGFVRPQLKQSTLSPVIGWQPSMRTLARGVPPAPAALRGGTSLAFSERPTARYVEASVGKILIGVVIGVVLVIWLLVSCAQALF